MSLYTQDISSLVLTNELSSAKIPTNPECNSSHYVHPYAYLTNDPVKGTGTTSKFGLKKGVLVFIDSPYALIPTIAPGSGTPPLCSRLQCSQMVTSHTSKVSCANHCTEEVVWCSSECQELSNAQHKFECSWLKMYAKSIRQEYSEEDFYRLWLMVRILAERDSEASFSNTSTNKTPLTNEDFASDWSVICRLRSNEDMLQPLTLKLWRTLVEKYLVGKHTMLPGMLDAKEMLTLTCQVETNDYDLWPQAIGIWPLPPPSVDRSESCYAYAMYLRTSFLNHSCVPNLMHQSDEYGRMVFHATRDIPAGEEFSLAYFDLACRQFMDVKRRRTYLENVFKFTCVCPRCLLESGEIEGQITDL